MPHAQPPLHPPDASGTNNEESGTPVFFPLVGNFNAVVPLSQIDTDSESHAAVHTPVPTAVSPFVRATAKRREHDEHEETTLVPARAARKPQALRTPAPRPSWPVMIMALALSLVAGLAAGVYLIKSSVPVEIQAPASITQDVTHNAATAAAAETTDSQPTQVASESRPEARPRAGTNLDTDASAVDVEVSAEKTKRDLTAPKRVTVTVVERTPERPARTAPPLTTKTPAPTEAVRPRRATSITERTPVLRAPERSLPVSPPPSSAKSKRVIQWP